MSFLRIHCHNCGEYWDVYGEDDYRHRKYKVCPYCKQEIDGQDWENQIVPAFGAMLDANRELVKTHIGYKAPLFSVDYIDNHYSQNMSEKMESAMTELQSTMEDLRFAVSCLADAIRRS